ncbi:MAG TPA: histone deacetylase [Longimicrobiales bacterium]|nr:histone deacetylase [Longimicrobiales bacterium]
MKQVALVSHPACALHDTGWGHPEHQGRLPAAVRALDRDAPTLLDHVLQAEAPPASRDELLRVHAPEQVARVARAVERAAERGEPVPLTEDTVVSGASMQAGLGAAGAALHATRLVLDGEAETAFVLSRPPGHHATPTRSMGFCLFNNVAIAARWAREEAGVERVLIVDWDVHHGNGTQDIFYRDPSVFFLSLHLANHYPGTGHPEEVGEGPGQGATHNIALSRDTSRQEYLDTFGAAVRDAVRRAEPELVLVSAGFDCLQGDPLGGLPLEPEDLHQMTRGLMETVRTVGGQMVTLLEGGYVPARLGKGVVQVVRALAGVAGRD